ncbi:MAG: DNA methyltransferase, partial [Nocardioidaceae bacterium]
IAIALYRDYFSTRRLRTLATTRTGTRHIDLWDAHLIVTDALAGDGLPTLALPGLAASLFARDALGVLDGAALPNRSLLAAVRALAQIVDPKTGVPRPVDYRNLDSEELGGVYEGLLAYTPRYHSTTRTFSLDSAAGNYRKKSGSYYTPSDLIALVLDEALDPLIAEAVQSVKPEAALLELTVLDPAVGSGHFVVAAARRLATALASVRTGDGEPGPPALRAATAEVIERCIYGVDLNDLAAEITKVALWLEAFDGSRPFPFLDAHIKVGNSLLGTTPSLLRRNIPDAAFTVLGDDDKSWTSKLKARNKAERARHAGQLTMFDSDTLNVETAALTKKARALEDTPATTLAQVRARADAWRRLQDDPELAARKLAADAWCVAFVQPKSSGHGQGITHDTLQQIVENPTGIPATVLNTVREVAQRYRFFHWHLEFPGIFTVPDSPATGVDPITGWQGGFSCVVGNPPWERVKIQDKEFFAAAGRHDIAEAKTAAIRTRMIKALATDDPFLYHAYRIALRASDGTSHLLLHSARYPLTGQGDVNTYSVFAETFRTIIAPSGAAGIITPTGLATDKTTAPFFADTLSGGRLIAFYDFENEAKIFAGVDHRFRFAVTAIAGHIRAAERTRFAFLCRHLPDVPGRRFELASTEVLSMNPNTGTLRMFRTRVDADITLGIYRRHPVLIRDGSPDGNPWGLTFGTLFHMANDSGLFRTPEDLAGASFNGWSYTEHQTEYLPLYEAKMLSHFDHRFSTYQNATTAQLNVGSLPRLSAKQHDDPNVEPMARYWVPESNVTVALEGKWKRKWLLGWRDITNMGNERTFVPSVLPASAVGNKFPLAFPADPACAPLLHAVWSSLVFDYVARQKIGGTGMTYFIVKQIACPSSDVFAHPSTWQPDRSLAEWVIPYVLELSYTSWRLKPYAEEIGDDGPPFRWNPERRALLRADLDAAMLHVYGLDRREADHVLDSFPVVRKYDERDHGEYRTKQLVLEAYDRMAAAATRGGVGWESLAGVAAGAGPRHPAVTAGPAGTPAHP